MRELLRETARVSWPALGERLLLNSALLIYFWVLSGYGPAAIAAYTIGVRLLAFSWIPADGHLDRRVDAGRPGARRARRAARGARGLARARASRCSSRCALFVVFALLRLPLAESFTDDAAGDRRARAVHAAARHRAAVPRRALHARGRAARRGRHGDAALVARSLGNWVFRVPLALLVAKVFHADVVWVWATVVFDHVTRAIWLTWAFRRERWAQNLGAGLSRPRPDTAH